MKHKKWHRPFGKGLIEKVISTTVSETETSRHSQFICWLCRQTLWDSYYHSSTLPPQRIYFSKLPDLDTDLWSQ